MTQVTPKIEASWHKIMRKWKKGNYSIPESVIILDAASIRT